MVNKRKQKRWLKIEFKRRKKEIEKIYEKKTAVAWRNLFVKAKVLEP